MTTSRRAAAVCLSVALLWAQPVPVLAYLKYGVQINGRTVGLAWNQTPVRYYIADQDAPGVSAVDLQAAVARAFGTWQAVPTTSVSYQFVGLTSASPLDEDGQSTMGFAARPDLDHVLAATTFLIDGTTGEILESDIFFNSVFSWSVAEAGEAGRYDVQSIALHEGGHLSGLGHSALGETALSPGGGRRVIASQTVMFPIAFSAGSVSGRALRDDDITGVSDLYPAAGFRTETGSVSGLVTQSGRGAFGAHVVAFDLTTGSLVGGFSLDAAGRFSILGLLPGPHVVRVEPLDDVDVDSFFDASMPVDLDFRVTFSDRLAVVPRGGSSGDIDVQVLAK